MRKASARAPGSRVWSAGDALGCWHLPERIVDRKLPSSPGLYSQPLALAAGREPSPDPVSQRRWGWSSAVLTLGSGPAREGPALHPHVPHTWLTQAERDANTIENLHVLVHQLEGRLKSATERIYDLEMIVGVEKRVLLDENQRLRQSLREVNRQLNDVLGSAVLSRHHPAIVCVFSTSRSAGMALGLE